jgi:hypothetical protein
MFVRVSPTFGNSCAPRQVVVRQGYCETTDRILHEIRGLETDMELLLVSCQSRTVCVGWSIPDWKINRQPLFFCGKITVFTCVPVGRPLAGRCLIGMLQKFFLFF